MGGAKHQGDVAAQQSSIGACVRLWYETWMWLSLPRGSRFGTIRLPDLTLFLEQSVCRIDLATLTLFLEQCGIRRHRIVESSAPASSNTVSYRRIRRLLRTRPRGPLTNWSVCKSRLILALLWTLRAPRVMRNPKRLLNCKFPSEETPPRGPKSESSLQTLAV